MKLSRPEKKIRQAIIKYVEKGSRLVAACSGGADSIALVDALCCLRQECGYEINVMHVEHGIRGQEALDDAEFVKNFCAERRLNFVCRHVKAAAYAEEEGLSLEDSARRLRYAALWQYVDELGADFLVTAHQADDQAETVLMQLLRGSGTAGAGGMQVQNGRLLRPLLFLQRSEIEAYCRKRCLQFCQDSTNDDVHYTRNRIRKELLPYLEKYFNPQLKKALGQTAILAQADNDLAEAKAQEFYNKNVQKENGVLICSSAELMQAFAAVRSRVIRMMWQQVSSGGELGFGHIAKAVQLIKNGSSGKELALPGKTSVLYCYGKLYMAAAADIKKMGGQHQPSGAAEYEVSLKTDDVIDKGVELKLPDGKILQITISREKIAEGDKQAAVPLTLAGAVITIRTRRDGDRFYPFGSSGSKKLKDYFIDCKMPRAERGQKLLVAAQNNILWIIGGRQAGYKDGNTKNWLVMRLTERMQKDE